MFTRVCVSVLLMLAAGSFLAYGQEGGTVLKVTPEQFDFGTVDEGIAATATATVHNTGRARIEIKNVRTS